MSAAAAPVEGYKLLKNPKVAEALAQAQIDVTVNRANRPKPSSPAAEERPVAEERPKTEEIVDLRTAAVEEARMTSATLPSLGTVRSSSRAAPGASYR